MKLKLPVFAILILFAFSANGEVTSHRAGNRLRRNHRRPAPEHCPKQKAAKKIMATLEGKERDMSLPHAIGYDEKKEELLIVDLKDDENILRIEPKTGKIKKVIPVHTLKEIEDAKKKKEGVRGESDPHAIAVNDKGETVTALSYFGKVRRYGAEGKVLNTYGDGKSEIVSALAVMGPYVATAFEGGIGIFKDDKLVKTITTLHFGKTFQALGAGSRDPIPGMAFDSEGNLYLSQFEKQRVVKIPKATSDDVKETAVAEMVAEDKLFDEGVDKKHFGPNGVTFDRYGDMYVGIYGTGEIRRFRKKDGKYQLVDTLKQKTGDNIRQLVMVGCDLYAVNGKGHYLHFPTGE